ncbi:MAG: hypothetical protein RBQ97_12275 [Acholeplasma sp.]|nr:hypothetical protein [Acholeplasma sp.]
MCSLGLSAKDIVKFAKEVEKNKNADNSKGIQIFLLDTYGKKTFIDYIDKSPNLQFSIVADNLETISEFGFYKKFVLDKVENNPKTYVFLDSQKRTKKLIVIGSNDNPNKYQGLSFGGSYICDYNNVYKENAKLVKTLIERTCVYGNIYSELKLSKNQIFIYIGE